MEENERKELLFYYESRQNPNGDPGFENQPRLMSDGRILVTDVRLKRTIRDFAKNELGQTLFVDFGEDGKPLSADDRAEEIVGSRKEEDLTRLLEKTFDVPLFGCLVTIREKKGKKKEANEGEDEPDSSKGGSFKVTGPVQFGLGKSVNQVEIIQPQITGRFIGDDKKGRNTTIGKFYSVNYALIKFQGVVNPTNLVPDGYWKDEKARMNFQRCEEQLATCLWNGTNGLISRSKFPQRSVLFIEVTYGKNHLYNDLNLLVNETDALKGRATGLEPSGIDFSKLVQALTTRKSHVILVRIKACDELKESERLLVGQLNSAGIKTQVL